MTYEKSKEWVAGGRLSAQTVMNKLRQCESIPIEVKEIMKVENLHVDADEDHVTLRGGKKCEVRLASVYRGVKKSGGRGVCKDVFHISGYGKNTDILWDSVLTEIEKRYDIDEKTITYLHGDGAEWIKSGLTELPNCKFVLDSYHKNKAIREMTAGSEDGAITKKIQNALSKENRIELLDARDSLIEQRPERTDKISKAASYLENHIEGIHIRYIDREARNGGCTEPHISNTLSRRLSSRPMAWSSKTLTVLVPALAAKSGLRLSRARFQSDLPHRAIGIVKRTKQMNACSPLAAIPEAIGNIFILAAGKLNPLRQALHSIAHPASLCVPDNFLMPSQLSREMTRGEKADKLRER
jgi:hypothetical protein